MARKSIWLTTVALSVFLLIGTLAYSQPVESKEPMEGHDRSLYMMPGDEHDGIQRPPKPPRPPRPPKPPRGRANKGHQRPPMDPKVREAREAIMTTAEAHRQLSVIFKEQGEIDKAAAQLKKIIDLDDSPAAQALRKKGGKTTFSRKVLPVYIQLAKMYVQNNRLSDAEKIINEGVAKYEKDQPHIASKLMLTLGQIFAKKGESKKAEETYKRVIELNSKALK